MKTRLSSRAYSNYFLFVFNHLMDHLCFSIFLRGGGKKNTHTSNEIVGTSTVPPPFNIVDERPVELRINLLFNEINNLTSY